jgi:hypothetical protein
MELRSLLGQTGKGRAMANLASIHRSEALDDESLHVIVQAYDDAWSLLQGSIFAAHPRTRETREMLERRIIEMARRGERDPIRLRDEAVSYFGLAV